MDWCNGNRVGQSKMTAILCWLVLITIFSYNASGDGPPRFASLPPLQMYHNTGSASLQLSCQIKEVTPVPTLQWFRNGVHILPGGVTYYITPDKTSSNLTIVSKYRNVSGDYQCAAENDYGRIVAGPTRIEMAYFPKYTLIPQTVTRIVPPGGTIEQSCPHVKSTPPVKVTWCSDDSQILYSQKCHKCRTNPQSWRTLVIEDGRLSISQIRREDAGGYFCCVHNHHTRNSSYAKTLTVHVMEGPIQESKLSVKHHSPSHIYVRSGEEASISIQFAYNSKIANTDLDVRWFKGSMELGNRQKSQIYIKKSQPADSGIYRAEATSPEGDFLSHAVELHVHERPTIQEGPKNVAKVIYGTNATNVTCNATGFPIPVIYIAVWQTDGAFLEDGKGKGEVTLKFFPRNLTSVRVTCNASNDVGWEEAIGKITFNYIVIKREAAKEYSEEVPLEKDDDNVMTDEADEAVITVKDSVSPVAEGISRSCGSRTLQGAIPVMFFSLGLVLRIHHTAVFAVR